jgi:hypothetical protein
MLSISEATLRTLEALARQRFARRFQAALAQNYRHFLPRFPEAVQAAIVGNMLGRASLSGTYGQRALLAFCEQGVPRRGRRREPALFRARR